MEAAKSFVLGYTGQRLVRLYVLKVLTAALAAAWVLTWASRSVFINFILILSAAVATRVYWESNPQTPAAPKRHRKPRHLRFSTDSPPSADHCSLPRFPPPAQADPKSNYRWRENVRSKVVEHAWETLCGSIVQEFIYDTWYHYLSPDKEFPAEIRRILNHAFGSLAVRARALDLRLIMEDASELLMEQLELYRDTRELVISDAQQSPAIAAAFTQGDLTTRELLLRERMEVDGNLHPALLHPEGDYKMLTAVSGGLVENLLDPADSNRAALRAVARELLSGCVLRPLMMWCTPYHVNKGLYRLMEEQATRKLAAPVPPMSSRQQGGGRGNGIYVPELDLAKTRAMQGHWEFEQRIVKNVEAEVTMLQPPSQPSSRPTSSRRSMPPPPPRAMRNHARSRSHDGLIQSATAAVAAIDGGGGVNSSSVSIDRGGLAGGPPDAQPARFWSETQQVAASTKGGGATKTGATTTTTAPPEVSSDSVTSRTSSMSATSPVRHGPRVHNGNVISSGTAGEGHIASFPVTAGTSETTDGTAQGSETTSHMRPSPFDEDSSASFSGLGGPPIGEAGCICVPAGGFTHLVTGKRNAGGRASGGPPGQGTEECFKRPSPAESLPGFVGLPRARVVAADLNTSGAKDFVVYKIRVGDDSGREWTVSRRYRHFEVLHRQLRGTPYYKSKLPAKRIFIHTQTEDFVEDRRNALDLYLQEVLHSPCLARSGDVWEFLRIDSERFEVPGVSHFGTANGGGGGGGGGTLKRGLSRTVFAGASSVGRGVVGAAVDVTRGVTMGVHEVTNAAVDGVGAVLNEARSGFAGLRHLRSASVPEELQDFDPATANFGFHGARTMPKKGDPLTRAGTGLLRTATASARKVRQALKSQPSLSQQQQLQLGQQYDVDGIVAVYGEDEGPLHSEAARALHLGGGGGGAAAAVAGGCSGGGGPSRSESSFGNSLRTSRSSSPTKIPRNTTITRKGSNVRPPRGSSPVKTSRRGGAAASASEGYYGVAERAAAFAPGYQPGNITGRAGYYTETGGFERPGLSGTTAVGLGGGGGGGLGVSLYNEIDDFGAPSLPISADSYSHGGGGGYFTADINGVVGGSNTSSPPPGGAGGGYCNSNTTDHPLLNSSAHSASQLDLEACTGISAPLYELVDCVFQLQTRGFFRRQVYTVARQVLSIAIGDAIDVYLLAKLSLLRQESTIGRVIQLIQSSLWPGGTWFQRTPEFKALHPEVSQLSFEEELMSPTARGGPRSGGPAPGMQADKYLTPVGPPPLDEEEVREAVWELLLRKAPSPLIRLVGRTPYNEGVQDLYEMIQSPTFMKQLGYGLLEIAALHLCPELKGLFQNLDSLQDQ
ncbi:hypothetical protein Ndes2526B_g07257 [Nannochloris sp. 'desiccata']|nr:hypothetical protein KSW81_004718 [Chlorella desiccata (nom. nud.)]KAH7618323.1 putative Serine/threonine-protein kinase Sgk3 [Chlorella desiccata (nom. nud.)]